MEPDFHQLWSQITALFPFLEKLNMVRSIEYNEIKFDELAKHLKLLNLDTVVNPLVIDHIQTVLRVEVAPQFWTHFTNYVPDGTLHATDLFKTALVELEKHFGNLLPFMEKLDTLRSFMPWVAPVYGETSMTRLLNVLFKSAIHSKIDIEKHDKLIGDFYKSSFNVYHHQQQSSGDMNESAEDALQCGGCSFEVDNCKCSEIIFNFNEANRILLELELLEPLAGNVITSLMHQEIEHHVQETCKGSFDTSFISTLENWLNMVVIGWLKTLYPTLEKSKKTSLAIFTQKLLHLLYETYTKTRIEQLFNIIIEYPDSDPAIEDLRICLQKTDLRMYLTYKLQKTLQTRLLHPGVNTPDIITAYIASIKALRQLDPTGVLLETVTLPVRYYLRNREDTMRCVVMSLTEEGPGELADELIRNEEANQHDENSWEEWQPDPIEAHITKSSKDRRSWDIISMLVTVYGSKEMFVHEYRNLLADRLLTQFSFNTEKEIRYLELLKLRFEDSQLHYCEVMLKDVYDSKRINSQLRSEPNFGLDVQAFPCSSMILSAQFWPPFKEETLELPKKIKDQLDIYTKAFETLKGNRTLNWKPHLGSVNLEIELKGRTISLTVSPTHAAIIWYFQDKNQWTIEELSGVLHIPPTVLRRRVAFWQSQGLLREVSTDTYLLVEESGGKSSKAPMVSDMLCEDDEAESIMASAQDQREEELQVFWTYIVGMLTNLDSLPPERIHQMLKMFASQGPSAVECTLPQLRHFLDRKVREHKLLFSGGFYKLPK